MGIGDQLKGLGNSARSMSDDVRLRAMYAGDNVKSRWQKVPGSAKVGAGVGMMTGLAVGGVKGIKKGQRAVFGGIQKTYGGWGVGFPIILAILDYALGKNGVPL